MPFVVKENEIEEKISKKDQVGPTKKFSDVRQKTRGKGENGDQSNFQFNIYVKVYKNLHNQPKDLYIML